MTRTVATLLALALISGCSKSSQKPAAPPPPHVSVGQPLVRDVVDWDEYIGRFQAPQSVTLSARINGVVTQILFKDGQDVKQGQPLFIIDPRPYRATLEQAQAQVASARAALANAVAIAARSEKLVTAQAVSKEEAETDEATVRTDRASLQAAIANADNARLNLSFTTVTSPVSGRVSSRRVSLGDQVTAQTTLLTTVVSLDPIWFTFDGAESFYLKYQREAQKGTRDSSRSAHNPVDIQLADETDYPHHGRMVFVDNAIDQGSGTIQAHAEVPNPNHFLTPGMFGRARLLGSGTYRAMLVPDEAIVTDQSRKTVFVLGSDKKVATRVVETGPEVMGLRAIRSGLAAGDLVVLDGLAMLQPGTPVDATKIVIKPRSQDAGPSATSVTVPQASTASLSGTAN